MQLLSEQRGNVKMPAMSAFEQPARTAIQLLEQTGELCQRREDAQVRGIGNCQKADRKELDYHSWRAWT